ncbi:MAG: alginate export family protein [Bryobacteraceae bacterium]
MRFTLFFAGVLMLTVAGYAEDGFTPANSSTPDPGPADGDASDTVKLGNVTFSGALRLRLYDWDWFQPSSGNNSYVYSGNWLRFGFSEKLDTWEWNVEFAVPFLLGLPSNATAPGTQGALGLGANYYTANDGSQNAAMIFPRQAYVRLNGLGGNTGSSLKLGRFEFNDGTEVAPQDATLAALKRDRMTARLVGTFAFSDVGRSFDGLQYVYGSGPNNLTFVAAIPTRGVFQVDGWGWNRVGFGYTAYTREWGTGKHAADTRFFAIEYDDWRHVLKTDNRPLAVRRTDLANIRIDTFGGHSMHSYSSSAGNLDLVLWGAGQTGRWGYQKQRSYAYDVEGGYQPKVLPAVKPWLRGGFFLGSGDGNPNDNTHGTFFQLLPTPRLYARFPFFNMMNNTDRFGMLILRPHSKVTISSEFHALRLTNANDLWYSGGGVFQPWTFGYTGRATAGARSLANLYDTSVEYRVGRKVTLTPYFGYAQGRAAMEAIYPHGKDGKFGYLELLYRF